MKEIIQIIGVVILILVVFLGLGWVIQGNSFFMYRFFAPKKAAVERQVFEQTKSYNQGVIQELNSQYQSYNSNKGQGEKDAIASVVRHQTADYDTTKLPPYLASFVNECRNAK